MGRWEEGGPGGGEAGPWFRSGVIGGLEALAGPPTTPVALTPSRVLNIILTCVGFGSVWFGNYSGSKHKTNKNHLLFLLAVCRLSLLFPRRLRYVHAVCGSGLLFLHECRTVSRGDDLRRGFEDVEPHHR